MKYAFMTTKIRIRKLTSKPSKGRKLSPSSTFDGAILKWRETEAKLLDDKPENILVKRLATDRILLMEDLKRNLIGGSDGKEICPHSWVASIGS